MKQKNIRNILKTAQPFRYLNDKQLASIESYGQILNYSKNENILTQGKPGDGIYILLQGTTRVLVKALGKGTLALAKLSKGNFFGEISLMINTQCTATVSSLTKSYCYFLNKDCFEAFFIGNLAMRHAISRALIEEVVQRQREMVMQMKKRIAKIKQKKRKLFSHRLSEIKSFKKNPIQLRDFLYLYQLPLFKFFSQNEFHQLFKNSKLLTINGRCDLPKSSSSCYFVIDGSLQAFIHSGRKKLKVAVHGPNTFICPISYIDGKSNLLTYRTNGPAVLIEFPESYLNWIKNNAPMLWKKLYNLFCYYFFSLQSKMNGLFIRLTNEKFESLILL